MKKQPLKTWEDFEEELVEINKKTKVLQQEKKRSRMEYPLFRGHSDSGWHLESTLDRIQKRISLSDYCRITKFVHEHVATCTGRRWDLDTKVPLGGIDLPAYEFMAYLRHNGFPSPLVDWTRSPYIAAYFAFGNIYSKAEDVAIFVHKGTGLSGQQPHIWILGPTIATDRKHYLQQSQYSVCVKEQDGDIYFANHEDVEDDIEEENVLTKYTIPMSEREKVLRELDSMNITAYSLFDSEPSLMETLAIREICFEKWDRLLASENE